MQCFHIKFLDLQKCEKHLKTLISKKKNDEKKNFTKICLSVI